MIGRAAVLMLALVLAGCGASAASHGSSHSASHGGDPQVPRAHPQAVEPTAGEQPALARVSDPVGDVHAHAPPLSEVRKLLVQARVYAKKTGATYINPLQYVNHWERTDQGVDATMPIGSPILAPGPVKILAIIPNWYAGQPLVYWELLNGPEAGRIQYVAEEITGIAPPGSYLQQGQVIARYAAQGTAIEFGWSTINGVTLAQSTTGYREGQITPAGCAIRAWLNALGANAGSGGC